MSFKILFLNIRDAKSLELAALEFFWDNPIILLDVSGCVMLKSALLTLLESPEAKTTARDENVCKIEKPLGKSNPPETLLNQSKNSFTLNFIHLLYESK